MKSSATAPAVNQEPATCCVTGADATPAARIVETSVTVRGKAYRRLLVIYHDDHGERKRKTFNRRSAATRFMAQCEEDARHREARRANLERRIGEDSVKITADTLRDALAAIALLKGRATLEEAARWYGAELARRAKAVPTVAELAERYMEEALGNNLRDRSIADLRHRLGKIVARFGNVRVDEVRGADVRDWLAHMKTADGKGASPTTKGHFRAVAAGLFNLAVDLEYTDRNPAMFKRRRGGHREARETAIFAPAEARALMEAAVEHCPELIAPLALGLFAGIRVAEIQRMTWERHVDIRAGLVKVTADIAKKRSCRNVDMLPNLVQWLALAPSKTGSVAGQTPAIWRHRLGVVMAAAGLAEWPQNGMRHSYGSYHLQHFGDPDRTALQMGHRDRGDMLFEHYRQVTTKADAAAYWAIVPATDADVIVFPKVG